MINDLQSAKFPGNPLPLLRSRWWTALLIVSLGVNLLIAGLMLGHRFGGGPGGSGMGQLIPGKFFADLPGPRRRELLKDLRPMRDDIRTIRDEANATAAKLADALNAANYDATQVKNLVAEFTTGAGSLAAQGGAVVLQLVDKLTPEERKILSDDIKDRLLHERGKK